MLFSNDRKQLRQMYFDAWKKSQEAEMLTPLEAQIVDVIGMHPEYHSHLEGDSNSRIDKDYQQQLGENNPFLHMGLHLGLREQLATLRPPGVKDLFLKQIKQLGNSHQAEHQFMEVLSQFIWQAQQSGTTPDDHKYITALKSLLEKTTTNKPSN